MAPRLFVLTGAGISAESGLATFRGQDGLWENHRIEDVASIDGYIRNPALVQRFYNLRRAQLQNPDIKPNDAHRALVELERNWPGEFLLVTQNVDDLHERAGSSQLIHLHGELLRVRCQKSERVFDWRNPIEDQTRCACCGLATTLRPHIVWFGEMPMMMDRIQDYLEACGIFISIGTSGQVYPAAGFVSIARSIAGSRTIEINMEATPQTTMFDEQHVGPATRSLPVLVRRLLDEYGNSKGKV